MGGVFWERVLKPCLIAFATFLAIRYITGSTRDGLLVAVVPLLLGVTSVLINLGYAIAALSVIAAVAWAVMPVQGRTHMAASVYHASGIVLPVSSDQGRSR